ncbi:MAG: PQQ-binding-like beta-propeller repeat protein [Myxococcales bacterium]|nr:PQQ-binding-like beta-propeller repeat protein [Myxococcales bacterium]
MTRNLISSAFAGLALLTGALALPAPAAAQPPDVREIPPVVMLLVDTSGSMMRKPKCVCRPDNPTADLGAACDQCLPNCNIVPAERNRWAEVLEALSGSFISYDCTEDRNRTGGQFTGAYDENAPIPFIRIGATSPANRRNDGIVTVFRNRVKFGLMTFDVVNTTVGALPQPVLSTALPLAVAQGKSGMFSYGPNAIYQFGGGGNQTYAINNGAQNDQSDGGDRGSLIPPGSETSRVATNELIADSVVDSGFVRPFGNTPIAGMLQDLDYFMRNDPSVAPQVSAGGPGDGFNQCRARYAILITDGFPNGDLRDRQIDCTSGPRGGASYPDGGSCPYNLPDQIVAKMIQDKLLTKLFVVGFDFGTLFGTSSEAASAGQVLNDIAAAGDPNGPGLAIFAENTNDLQLTLTNIIDEAAPGTTTRTVPGWFPPSDGHPQERFATGFQPLGSGEIGDPGDPTFRPWKGVLERRRYPCNGTSVDEQPVDDTDRFQVVLNNRAARRKLFTVVPTVLANSDKQLQGVGDAALVAALRLGSPYAAPTESNVSSVPFESANVSAAALAAADDTDRDNIIAWIHGDATTPRADRRLGSIYHSSPRTVSRPLDDIAQQSFNEYRREDPVATRPRVVYVASNDGILHAFDADTGEELWGFIPPYFLTQLKELRTQQLWTLDGSPVVQDVFRARAESSGLTKDDWMTLLVVGMRQGGKAYIALDVTDPNGAKANGPKFLWQFTDADMGETFGKPAITQIKFQDKSHGDSIEERGVVILPGGRAPLTGVTECTPLPVAMPPAADIAASPSSTVAPRATRQCWPSATGRAVYFVDAVSGRLIKKLDSTIFPAPIIGGISTFPATTGTPSTVGYVTDADGVIWMLDYSDTDTDSWTAQPIYDIFHGRGWDEAQPALYAPLLSTDDQGRIVILQGTGDIDALENIGAFNRVVSLTQDFDTATKKASTIVNWELSLEDAAGGFQSSTGEQVTGPLEIFNGTVYFATFRPLDVTTTTNLCNFGSSYFWGVKYLDYDSSTANPIPQPKPGLVITSSNIVSKKGPFDNQIIMGARVTQTPDCTETQTVSVTDPYIGSRTHQAIKTHAATTFEITANVGGLGTGDNGGQVARFDNTLPPIPFTPFTKVTGLAGSTD